METTTSEFLFGDSITALAHDGDAVHAQFERAAEGSFDLVVGTAGIVARNLAAHLWPVFAAAQLVRAS